MGRSTLFVVLCILACAVAAHATAAPSRALGACSGSHLAGRVAGSSGAAGTISLAIRLRNVSNRACTMTGYPRLRIVNRTTRLPTRVTHGGLSFLQRSAKRVRLAPGGVASILVAYEDVPVGKETSCRSGNALLVHPPGSALAVRVKASTTACGRGHLWTSPVLAGRDPPISAGEAGAYRADDWCGSVVWLLCREQDARA